MATLKFGDLPPAYLDGWHAHRYNRERNRNPYDSRTQWVSYEAWTEGWLARKYAERNKEDTTALDEYQPRYSM